MDADPGKLVGLAGITRAYVRKLHALSCVLDRADDREQWLQALDRPVVILTPESLPSGATSLDAWARQHGRDPKNVRRINPAFAGGRIAKARGQTLQDRKRVVAGTSVSVSVDLGGRRGIKQQKKTK